MRNQGYGFNYQLVIHKKKIQLVCFAFVDDTDLVYSRQGIDMETLLGESQEAINTWRGDIWASEGDLSRARSYWYLVKFHHNNGRWKYATKEETPGELSIEQIGGPETLQ